jgi:hypothetical protein
MSKAPGGIVRRRITKLSLVLTISTFGILFLPRWAATLIIVIGLLVMVAEFDNQTGTFLPLAILFVIVLAVLVILLGMMAFLHG